ncbi:MAG: alpha/beta fold hydrolase [Myxococcota bacterium]
MAMPTWLAPRRQRAARRPDTASARREPIRPSEERTLATTDGHRVAIDIHLPPGAMAGARAAVVLAPAMGVKRGFYRPIARYLAERGLAVVSLDYRGIGDSAPASLRGFRAELHDWADLDLAAVVAFARARWPDLPLHWLGHSVGGQLLGLLPHPPIARAAFVGSQSGHWRLWGAPKSLLMAGLWYGLIPGVVTLTGKLPMRALGQGEDVPAGVGLEWARWGRSRDYIMGYARERGGLGFKTFAGKLRSFAIADDGYAPPRSVEALTAGFEAADARTVHVAPKAVGLRSIGHFGAMRPSAEAAVWAPIARWLGDGVEPG